MFVVDDEEFLAEAIVSFLRSCGYDAMAFFDPVKALDSSASLKPNLVLSDFNMQGMDGLTLALNLTERHPGCKVLMMTALELDAITHPAFRRFQFLQKPVSLFRLLDTVVEALGTVAD